MGVKSIFAKQKKETAKPPKVAVDSGTSVSFSHQTIDQEIKRHPESITQKLAWLFCILMVA